MPGHEPTSPVNPPWVQYPQSDPLWGGWRQGVSQAWLLDVWLPFWKALDPRGREDYLARWPPPDEEWGVYLDHHWR